MGRLDGKIALITGAARGQGEAEARVFAAPGPFQVVSSAGRFALADLDPATARLHAWHPRFPPATDPVSLAAGTATRVDLELRVERAGVADDAR